MKCMLKQEIEEALQQLVGLPIWGSTRAGGLQGFQFGAKHIVPVIKRGVEAGTKTVGDFALHVQCAWRITGPEGIVVGSKDVSYPKGDPFEEPTGFECDKVGSNRRDEKIENWMVQHQAAPLKVVAVTADSVGGAVLTLAEGYALELFPNDTLPIERWRLFDPHSIASHFVVTAEGSEVATVQYEQEPSRVESPLLQQAPNV
jgi:hypothetical protein